jgi:hypothetical protein
MLSITKPYRITINGQLKEGDLLKGIHIVILHATRIPPHIGMIAGGEYHSLSIKGQEVNQSLQALIKNIRIRKIPSVFIKIKKHSTFSDEYLKELFVLNVLEHQRVEVGGATCLSPVKKFFEDNYSLSAANVKFIFELLPLVESKGHIESISSAFIENSEVQLPVYNQSQINAGIEEAEAVAARIRIKNN